MNLILSLLTLTSVAIVHGQGEKGTSIIPFPRVGRSGVEGRFYMDSKRGGNSMTPGLIPFPRVGRGDGMHEVKRQLIPFPRVGKRVGPYWRPAVVDQYAYDYEDLAYPVMDGNQMMGVPSLASDASSSSSNNNGEEIETDKRSNNNNGGGMWFGPRLGKRKKRSIETDSSAEHSRDSLDTRTLLKILHNFNWAIVPIKERRATFTPRLGRSSSEEQQQQQKYLHHSRPQVFTPRLGRSQEISSGEVDFEDEVPSARSTHYSRTNDRANNINDNSNKNELLEKSSVTSSTSSSSASESTNSGGGGSAPFAPRTVRDHMSPRLGRSGEDHD